MVPYVLASALATAPYSCLFAYMGAASSDLLQLLAAPSGALPHSPTWLLIIACVMVCSAAGLFVLCKQAVLAPRGGGGSGGAALGAAAATRWQRALP